MAYHCDFCGIDLGIAWAYKGKLYCQAHFKQFAPAPKIRRRRLIKQLFIRKIKG